MYRAVSSKVSFPDLERRILAFWRERGVFEESVKRRRGRRLFVLYDGPPTANASPGIHHALARVFKDLFPRYKTMKGFYAPRRAGWDTHGLPVELEVENALGLRSKPDIEAYGVAEFNSRCRQNVMRYVKDWEELTDRIGFWIDMWHPYVTFENDYIETCWWIIKQLWDKDLVYQGYKVTPHCPRCETSLSSHEVALGYKDDTVDPSVYIKFRLIPEAVTGTSLEDLMPRLSSKPAFLLAWTTTPWTLPGNTALAVAPAAEYSVLEGDSEYLILAADLVKRVMLDDYLETGVVKGREIDGMRYEPLFNPHNFGVERQRFCGRDVEAGQGRLDVAEAEPGLAYPVIAADFVSLDDGTGIVHIAPSFGEVDYQEGEARGLCFVRDYVDQRGMIRGQYAFSDRFVKEADPLILDDLEARGLLYRRETVEHTYPFCWRCSTPLLYYAKPSWYIKTTACKERLVSGNEEINWHPEYIKYGRFGDWLNNNVDWAVSRERYWGTPLPIWRCTGCGHEECVGGMADLKGKEGVEGADSLDDMHRPFVDDVTFACSECAGRMQRVPEVLDCWFDSGAMPVAQWHYPFEHADVLEDGRFPADYICEAVDQTRGWFYSLHAISILLFGEPCYRNVICLGHILDATGEKMSKSKGNVVTPYEVLDATGADALRWYMYTSSPPGNVRRFSKELVEEVVRKFMLTLWNTYSFFVTYAKIDGFNPRTAGSPGDMSDLDRWVLSELNKLVRDVTTSLDTYDPTTAGRRIEDFVDDLSNWYIRRSRKRFWKSENDDDKLAAYSALYACLYTLVKLLAPFTPFVAEEMYQNLVRSIDEGAPESVHLTDYPEADSDAIDERLSADVRLIMEVSSMGRSARSRANIKVRQPLSAVKVTVASDRDKEAIERNADQLRDELNVKEVVCARGEVSYRLEPNRKQLRRRFGKDAERIAGLIEGLAAEEREHVASCIRRRSEVQVGEYRLSDQEISLATDTPGYIGVLGHAIAVEVSTEITPELADEGLARELVHRLQYMRRSAGFDIADHIETHFQADDRIRKVMKDYADYIRQETLSRSLEEGHAPEGAYVESHKLEGADVTLAVKRADA